MLQVFFSVISIISVHFAHALPLQWCPKSVHPQALHLLSLISTLVYITLVRSRDKEEFWVSTMNECFFNVLYSIYLHVLHTLQITCKNWKTQLERSYLYCNPKKSIIQTLLGPKNSDWRSSTAIDIFFTSFRLFSTREETVM